MKKILAALAAFLCLNSVYAQSERVGLVLSGGGARGIAHIGLIQALEENNIPIDYITGTSMGAIVGGMYSMGYTPTEMMDLLKSDEFKLWQAGKIDDNMINYFKQDEFTPEFFRVKTSFKDSLKIKRSFLPSSLINPLPMNFAFMKLFSHATVRSKGNFNNLFVPFRAVASDVYNKEPIIMSEGDLGDAVRASMSFPFVFKPIKINGTLAYDGGIYNNYPVDIMETDFAPDFIVGSVVSENPTIPEEDDLMGQIENMIMHKTNYEIDSLKGISIKYDLNDVSLLDFQKADDIYKFGYEKGLEYVELIKSRVAREMPSGELEMNRLNYRSNDPVIEFNEVIVEGANNLQSTYIKDHFQRDESKPFTMSDAENGYFSIFSDSKISEIMPTVVEKEDGTFALKLNVKLNQDFETLIGGNISSLNSNRIFLGFNYRMLNLYALDLSAGFQLSQSYTSAQAKARIDFPTKRLPLSIDARYAFIRQKYYDSDRLFDLSENSCFIDQQQMYAMINIAMPLNKTAKMSFGTGYGILQDRYYESKHVDFSTTKENISDYYLLQVNGLLEWNKIRAKQYPTSGYKHTISGMFVTGNEKFKDRNTDPVYKTNDKTNWFEVKGTSDIYYHPWSKFVVGTYFELLMSNKKFYQNYTATILQAPAFMPTIHSTLVFRDAFRAMNYAAVGVKPIWLINSMFQLRGEVYGFQPFRKIESGADNKARYADFKIAPEYIAEVSGVMTLPFATIALYVNRYSTPKDDWNFGLNIGYVINTRKFLNN